MLREGFGQLLVERERFGQCIKKTLCILFVELNGLVLMNSLFGASQSAGQNEIADCLTLEGRRSLNKILGALFQAQVNSLVLGNGDRHVELLNSGRQRRYMCT